MANHDQWGTTLSIDGGAGSISFTLAEIAESGLKLGRLAELLEPLADRLEGEWLWLCQASAGTAQYPDAALDAMRVALWSFRRAHMDTAELAAQATQAGANYAATEARNAAIWAQLGRITALGEGLEVWAAGPLMPWRIAVTAAGQLEQARKEGVRDTTENFLNNGPAFAAGLPGPGVAVMYLLAQLRRHHSQNSGVAPAFALRKVLDATRLTTPGYLDVRRVPVQELHPGLPPLGHDASPSNSGEQQVLEASFRGLLTGSLDAYGYPPGSISVVRIIRPDESIGWVVHLPGTEDWSTLDSENPFDMEGNLEALTAASHQQFQQEQVMVQDFIRAALSASGALAQQEVLITGHSGGGIHAAAAAANPAFLSEVNVTMVVIAGAPARNQDVQPGIAVLDLQNEHDIVTAADFGAPPATAHWVTVTSHRPDAMVGKEPREVLAEAHSMTNYLHDAAAVDSSNEPALVAFRERLGIFLGVGIGAGVTIQGVKSVYQGRDVNHPARAEERPALSGNRAGRGAPQPRKGADYSKGER